jgi:Cytochrome c biogenesis factor
MNMKQQASVAFVMGFLALSLVACREDPQKAKVRFVASGDRFFAEKNYAEAIIQYRNAVTKDGSFGEARFKLGTAYDKVGDGINALREFVRAADLMPGSVEAQLRAAQFLSAAGQFPEAKARAIAVLAKDPKNVVALVVMGNALVGMKDVEGAIQQVEEAIDSAPAFSFAYANLGILELKRGQSLGR